MKRNLIILFVFSVVVFQWSPLHSQTTNTSIENKGIVTVNGLVTDEDSQTGVPGVTVMLKGTNTGTVTDRDGKYVINVSESGGVLIFSFVGYATQEIELGNRSVIDVVLKPDTYLLEEFVIVGYGEQRKSDITGSISSIEVENLDRLPLASIDDAMIGKAAGVQISKQSGTPGTGVRVRIRGTNSISASNDPLYVVDGIPMIPESNSKVNASEDFPDYLNTKSNSITDINPADIASIEILKDASATAIYGSRGANGVVLITTKRGKEGKGIMSLNHYSGVQLGPTNMIEMMDSREFLELMNEASANDGLGENFYTNQMGLDINDPELQNTNWYDEIMDPAPICQTQFSAQGGSNNIRYYTGLTYFDQEGVQIGAGFKRFNGRLNLDFDASDRLTIGTSLGISRSILKRTETDASFYGVVVNAQAGDPTMPVYEQDGSYADPFNYGSWWMLENPVKAANEYNRYTNTNRLLGTIFGEVKLTSWLKFKTAWSVDYTDLKDEQYISSLTWESIRAGANGLGQYSTYQDLTWLSENTLTFDYSAGSSHRFNAVLGYSAQESQRDDSDIRARQFPMDGEGKLGSASSVTVGYSGGYSWGIESYFARLNYAFKGKYLLTLTTRADGSSRFGINNKFGIFPSGSVAWRISEEGFMKESNLFSDLKLRFSHGLTGNQEGISNFASRYLWALNAAYNGQGGMSPSKKGVSQIANPDLTWEKTTQTNLGIDIEVFHGKIGLIMDAFVSNTKDLLLSVPVPGTSGTSVMTKNAGKLRNKGLEIALNSVNLDRALTWSSGFNISFIRNEVVEVLNDGEPQDQSHILMEGMPLGTFYMIHFLGVDPQTGDAMFEDIDGNGVINSDDSQVVGTAQPDFFGGLSNTLSYKNFNLDFFFQFNVGNKIFNRSKTQIEQLGYNYLYFSDEDYANGDVYILPNGNNSISVMDRWRQPGDITDIPRASVKTKNYQDFSDQWLEDGSYLRLKNIELSYTLPNSLLQRTNVFKSIRIFVQAQNLLTFTKYTGFDPEIETSSNLLTQGQDYSGLGQMRTILAGFNIGF